MTNISRIVLLKFFCSYMFLIHLIDRYEAAISHLDARVLEKAGSRDNTCKQHIACRLL